jgi:EAL domain-containing protein (putative c-di-GMP-specific phosphodiesterase class I)
MLHLDTVAEGIEDAAQANELTLLGCRTGQGYHFARPLDADAVSALIEEAAHTWPTLAHPTAGPVSAVAGR